MTKHIYTYGDVHAAAKAVLSEFGEDYVYHTVHDCTYADPDTMEPSCFVGQIIYRLDEEEFNNLAEYEQIYNAGDSNSIDFIQYEEVMDIDFTRKALVFMQALQDAQDRRNTWGESVRFAVNFAEWQVY